MSKQEFFIEDEEWAKDLEFEYEQYMGRLAYSIDADDTEEIIESLSGEPYCGCSTCDVREQLFFLVPRIIKAYKEGQVVLNED